MSKELLISLHPSGPHVYTDMTYRCDHWNPEDYSEWKLEGGRFWHKHKFMNSFSVQDMFIEENKRDAIRVQEALDKLSTKLIEEVLLAEGTNSESN